VSSSCLSRCLSLNGSHGEATESDDVKGKRSSNSKIAGRIAAKTVLNQLGAPPETYGLLANVISGVRKSAQRKVSSTRKAATSRVKAFSSGVASRGMQMARIPMGISSSSQLSVAASRYLLSFMDPFSNKARTAYLPQPPTCRTRKCTAFIRGQFNTGTAGCGFIMFSPSTANDQNCVYYTTGIFTTSAFAMPIAANANGVMGAKLTNLPYSRAQMTATAVGSTIEGRIVSMGLRIYYASTVVGCGGTLVAYSDPDTDNIVGLDFATLGSRDISEIRPIEVGKSYSTVAIPVRAGQTQFPASTASVTNQLYPYSDNATVTDATQATSTLVGPPCVGILVQAPSTAMITFNYEIVMHIEYNGQGCSQSDLTPSSADTIGYDHVQSLLNDAIRLTAADPVKDFPTILKQELARRGLRMANIPDY